MRNKLQKVFSGITVGVLTAAIIVTGTYAWQSISQNALNEEVVSANPGGRLHDDFNGSNKDVYVENFGDEAIFARIRLYEYMEIGEGAGLKDNDPDNKAQSVVPSADIDNLDSWTPHIPANGDVLNCADPFHAYRIWQMGGSTVYMPTFNMNKDSLEADINGSYAGKDGDPSTGMPYDDYHPYAVGDKKNGYEIWDADDNTSDELAFGNVNIRDVIGMDPGVVPGVEDTYATIGNNIMLNKGTDGSDDDNDPDGVEHIAKSTLNAQVITMAQWETMGRPIGNYWVYDTDGWAYWAAPIEPGTATGLLLDGITRNGYTSHFYYGINVVAQFATAGDWGAAGEDGAAGSGFYADGITDQGLTLLNTVADLVPKVTGITILQDGFAVDGNITMESGEELNLSALANLKNPVEGIDTSAVEWSISPGVDASVFSNGVFKPTTDNANQSYTITVTSKYNSGISTSYKDVTASITVTVNLPHPLMGITITEGSTVTADNIDWYVLKIDEENNKALIWATKVVHSAAFGSKNLWEGSAAQTYLNGTFYNSLTTLRPFIQPTTIKTRSSLSTTAPTWSTTTDYVFLLSEADVFGTFNGGTAVDDDYTIAGERLVSDDSPMLIMEPDNVCFLRSPYTPSTCVCVIRSQEYVSKGYSIDGNGTVTIAYGYRPAMWVELPSET